MNVLSVEEKACMLSVSEKARGKFRLLMVVAKTVTAWLAVLGKVANRLANVVRAMFCGCKRTAMMLLNL
jgi:hypothetical protein